MRPMFSVLFALSMLIFAGCDRVNSKLSSANASITGREDYAKSPATRAGDNVSAYVQAPVAGGGGGGKQQGGQPQRSEEKVLPVSFTDLTAVQAASIERKIIRNAELSIELDSPTDGQRKISTIAESLGGFVVTSDLKQSESGSQSTSNTTVTVTVRVPAMQFASALEKIRGIGGRVKQEKISGQDVTEEYIDLEARIRTKRALEAQFLEIMKQARKVSDALEVQSQLAEVRTEIERLEGRRRFLENQSALSTITITLQTSAPVVTATTSSFFSNIKQAFGESVDLATDIVLGFIRLVIVLIPILLLIVLPGVLLLRFLSRRYSWFKKQPSPIPEPE